ncbi:molybdopterin-guanine dinucleotide biosynthesis protein B [uncultured Clostridium sp.]|uniref:molybdopterin-guanine dinucleotide biosynthesis protein B n=1 Tax=uncultured Clostridium sp. TaxID=59620 RepID=UPI0026230D2E|nr:molybdopterin-guanine dinucleotide biosynthesis protein B [uncultured Clostridium sp.]
MSRIINVVGECSNVGKTTVVVGIIKELKKRGFKVGTIKHHSHTLELDKKGKDTYKHREAGAEEICITSIGRTYMMIEKELDLDEAINLFSEKDFIIVEGYKKSNLNKIEVFNSRLSTKIITPVERLICVASDTEIDIDNVEVVDRNDYERLVDLILKFKEE